jgi:hypothetical protein
MNKWILTIFALLSFTMVKADTIDNWQIHLNNKLILKGNVGADEPAVIQLSFKDATGSLKVTYRNDAPNIDWNRTFTICDADDNVLLKKEIATNAGSVVFSMQDLKKLAGKKQVHIYTVSLPNDPNVAATVRVRRFLLGTIAWK